MAEIFIYAWTRVYVFVDDWKNDRHGGNAVTEREYKKLLIDMVSIGEYGE